jgi:hypothetical protein
VLFICLSLQLIIKSSVLYCNNDNMMFYIPKKASAQDLTTKLCGDTFACKNGSVCKTGDGNEVDQRHKHLSLLSSMKSDVDGSKYYCECLPGFIGHDCSVEVKECASHREDLVHSCYFGSECIEADNEYGLLDKFCDCSRAHKEDGTFVAGLMCQYTSSTICVDDDASTTDAYCTNGGTCQSIVGSDEDFPGCDCEKGKWDGKHCEFADGVLKDDALDLFSVRVAEIIYEENLHGLGLTAAATTTSDENFNVTIFGVGFGVVVGVGISLLTMTLVHRVRKNKRQRFPEDEYKSFVYDSQAPPPNVFSSSYDGQPSNVFSSSRKKEVEAEDEDESTMMFDTECDDKYEDDVEMLDEATSRILESQFRRSEVGGAHSNEEELGGLSVDYAAPSYYGQEDEALDGSEIPRIIINSGRFPLSTVANELPSTMSSIMSLDGENNLDDDDDDHSNIMSLDGNFADNDDVGSASNYRILSYV